MRGKKKNGKAFNQQNNKEHTGGNPLQYFEEFHMASNR